MVILLFVRSTGAPGGGGWAVHGRDPGGTRSSPLTQITRDNVKHLTVPWTYHTGIPDMSSMSHRPPSLEVTPLVVEGTMYVIPPTAIVAALAPSPGNYRWLDDPDRDPPVGHRDFANRARSYWLVGLAYGWSVTVGVAGWAVALRPASCRGRASFGALRRGAGRSASSFVGPRGYTGMAACHFRSVHHAH